MVNRRSFLLASAATAAIAQTDRDTAGTGMIGVGNRGPYLLEAAMAQPRARILALSDIKPDRLDKAATAAARDNPATYSDWRKILDRKDIDEIGRASCRERV